MSVITFVVCPSAQLLHLHMETWGWTSSYPSTWVSGSQSFPTDGESRAALLSPVQDLPGFHSEPKASLETALMIISRVVRCPCYQPVFDSQTVDCCGELLLEFMSHFAANWMLGVFYKPEISFNAISILMKSEDQLEQAPNLLQSRWGHNNVPCCTTTLALITAPIFVIPTPFSLDK